MSGPLVEKQHFWQSWLLCGTSKFWQINSSYLNERDRLCPPHYYCPPPLPLIQSSYGSEMYCVCVARWKIPQIFIFFISIITFAKFWTWRPKKLQVYSSKKIAMRKSCFLGDSKKVLKQSIMTCASQKNIPELNIRFIDSCIQWSLVLYLVPLLSILVHVVIECP